jgi:hypothetical protein
MAARGDSAGCLARSPGVDGYCASGNQGLGSESPVGSVKETSRQASDLLKHGGAASFQDRSPVSPPSGEVSSGLYGRMRKERFAWCPEQFGDSLGCRMAKDVA